MVEVRELPPGSLTDEGQIEYEVHDTRSQLALVGSGHFFLTLFCLRERVDDDVRFHRQPRRLYKTKTRFSLS